LCKIARMLRGWRRPTCPRAGLGGGRECNGDGCERIDVDQDAIPVCRGGPSANLAGDGNHYAAPGLPNHFSPGGGGANRGCSSIKSSTSPSGNGASCTRSRCRRPPGAVWRRVELSRPARVTASRVRNRPTGSKPRRLPARQTTARGARHAQADVIYSPAWRGSTEDHKPRSGRMKPAPARLSPTMQMIARIEGRACAECVRIVAMSPTCSLSARW